MDPKPKPGYTGECRKYAQGYTVRTRVHQVVTDFRATDGWLVQFQYDIYLNGLYQETATSIRLAEEYVRAHTP
jgi:hypothetical protein